MRRLVGSGAAAVRSLHAATTPEPGDLVIGLGVDQINRRFAAAFAAAGLEGRRTSHGRRVGLAVELTIRGASTHALPARCRFSPTRWWRPTTGPSAERIAKPRVPGAAAGGQPTRQDQPNSRNRATVPAIVAAI